MKAAILIADDEKIQREMLGEYLKKKGYAVWLAASGMEALDIIKSAAIDVLVTDQKMPGMSGTELAARIQKDHPNISSVILTAYGTIGDAVTAMKEGVEDYLTKPVDLEELEIILMRIFEKRQLVRENEWLKDQIRKAPDIPGIIYVSETMKEVMSKVARAAESHATVLIIGESGTGKELVARAIHNAGDRRGKPFVAVNCSAVPENLIESEFFGHEKGAFTGADRRRIGRFELAGGGTIFLDEIGEIPLHVQVKLLRVLQERSFERVGGNETVSMDARIITATNRNIEEEVKKGSFRQDLYFRLNVVSISIPPLRSRRQDIPVLVRHYLDLYSREHGKPVRSITPEALDCIVKYPFPGNVRELSNCIEQAIVLTRGDTVTARDLPPSIIQAGAALSSDQDAQFLENSNLDDRVAELERNVLRKAMKEAGGNKSAAARLLGVSERKIRYMVKKYGEETE